MSNQLVITSGAKVRNLSGVLTGTSGVVNSVPLGGANGVATLDSSGKVPLSQLPASVITYLGTWNASTNTPTLTNGVGDVGDLYICNVAGTVNFGAGPITFAVGDWVIYSGTTWEKSGGASGTVTSVAMTVPTGLSVTGSPITTSGTLALSLSSGYTIPTTSFLSGLVPYTGATSDVNLGLFDLKTAKLWLYDEPNDGYGSIHLSDGSMHFEDADGHTMFDIEDGFIQIHKDASIQSNLFVSDLTAIRNHYLPNASGTLALTSDIPSLANYVTLDGTQTITGLKTFSNQTIFSNSVYINSDLILKASGTSSVTYLQNISSAYITTSGLNALGFNSNNDFYMASNGRGSAVFTFNNAGSGRTYTLPNTSGTVALTSDIPSLTNYVTLNTLQTITGVKFFDAEASFDSNIVLTGGDFVIGNSGFDTSINTETLTASRSINFPNKSGVVAMTSDIPSLSGYVQGSGTTNYHAKFTASSTIGNSMLTDDGTTLQSIGATRSNLYLKAASNSYYSQLAFTNGSNGSFGGISYNNSGQYMQFEANSSEWMRLNASGNFSIGNTNDTYKLDVTGTGRFTGALLSGNHTISGIDAILTLQGTRGTGGTHTIGASGANNTNLSIVASSAMYLTTNGSDRMTITSSGNVGIGTSSPNQQLTLKIVGSANSLIAFQNSAGSATTYFGIPNAAGDVIATSGTADTCLRNETGSILFATNGGTERMRITSDGKVAIGTSTATTAGVTISQASSNVQLTIHDQARTATGAYWYFQSATGSLYIGQSTNAGGAYASLADRIIMRPDGTLLIPTVYSFTIGASANVNVASDGTIQRATSSIKYKRDVIDYDKGLDIVNQMRPVYYKGISEMDGDTQYAGFIAEEIDELGLKEFVQYNLEGGAEGLGYGNITALLVKAIQEQQDQIKELSAKVSALENK